METAPSPPLVCAYCQTPIASDDGALETCPACRAHYHAECWSENGGCAVYGCTHTPPAEPRAEIETPVSWWGRENKPCPVCGQEILAAAMRCRHCGATFASAKPEDSAEFQRRAQLQERRPELRRKVVWQFVLSVVPLSAPIGAVMGVVWFLPHRAEIEALPPLFPALGRLGLFAGLVQTAAFVVLTLLYASFR